ALSGNQQSAFIIKALNTSISHVPEDEYAPSMNWKKMFPAPLGERLQMLQKYDSCIVASHLGRKGLALDSSCLRFSSGEPPTVFTKNRVSFFDIIPVQGKNGRRVED